MFSPDNLQVPETNSHRKKTPQRLSECLVFLSGLAYTYRYRLCVQVQQSDEDLPDEELCVQLIEPRVWRLEDAIEQVSTLGHLHDQV